MTDLNGPLRELVARGRTRHALLAVDTVTVTRVTGQNLNTTTGAYTPTTSTIYTGPARYKREVPREREAGESERASASPVLVLPYDATGADLLRKGDTVTFTASVDASLVGRTCTVIGPEHGTTTTAHRWLVEEVTA
jgi:hypothetical protein